MVVAGVKPDARFIQDVERIDKRRTQSRCKRNPLHLAAGERSGLPIQCQISQPDIPEIAQPVYCFIHKQPAGFVCW